MNLDIDSIIFIGFLTLNLILGLWSSRGITTMKEYAVGDRSFSTPTLVATIVATWVSGSLFFNRLSETYNNGLYYIWGASLGPFITLLCMGYIFAPRMSKFLGKLSIADAMGSLYGQKIQIISAIASIIGGAGLIAVQFKVTGSLFEFCFNVDPLYGVVIGASIVTLYSTLGGIKSVTFTDVIQFITFGTIIPIIGFFVLNEMESLDIVSHTLQTNPSFDYTQVFDFTQPKSFWYLFLFLYMILPAFNPTMFQRISMAKNVKQAERAFIIASLVYFVLNLILVWVAILVLSTNPNLAPKEITKHLIFHYSYAGLKGLTLAGIMAMVMSTADSYINCMAVTCINDLLKPLKINYFKNDLMASRFASLFIGIFGLLIALKGESLLKIVLYCNAFYIPIVSGPFTLAVLGFNTTSKSVLIAMSSALILVISWHIANITIIDPIVPGMFVNLVFLLGSHYLLKQPGGWKSSLPQSNNNKKFFSGLASFEFMGSLDIKNLVAKSVPSTSGSYISVGFFCMAMIFATMHSMSKDIRQEHLETIKFIMFSSLVASTLLISQPIWPWKENLLASGIIWNFVIFSVLICVAFGFVVITNFAVTQVMIFMINLIIIAGLLRWQMAVIMILTGICLSIKIVEYYFGNDGSMIGVSAQLQIVYLLLLVTSIVVVVFRPKQEYQALTEEKNQHLSGRIDTKDKEVQEALALKSEFIRNVTHEYHAPMTGVMSMAETLHGSYDKLSDDQRREAIGVIVKSSQRLKAFDDNISTLARLNKPNYILNKENINLSNLVLERVKDCRKLYEGNKEDREFILDIEEKIKSNLDKTYIIQLVDNLLINAIKYCDKGKINVKLKQTRESIAFAIEDEGIGIPTNELLDIFEPFTLSSKTKSQAGGRGVGLSTCKRIVEVHGGVIRAESNGTKGAIFTFEFPV